MIKLNSDTFTRAIKKAQTVRPACSLAHSDEITFTFIVARSDGRPAVVDIWHEGGTLWTSCDCAAGSGLHRRGFPMPCYHVAAAALSIGLLPAALPVGAHFAPTPEMAASRQVPAPLIDLSELAPIAPAPQTRRSLAQAARKAARALRVAIVWLSPRSARA